MSIVKSKSINIGWFCVWSLLVSMTYYDNNLYVLEGGIL